MVNFSTLNLNLMLDNFYISSVHYLLKAMFIYQ
nr:MAG TPA: hypothetical protein [Caudoviricetes sp.]